MHTATQIQMTHPVHQAVEMVVQQPDYVIVQLGAYIGNTANDPLYGRFSGTGRAILVEPDPRHFNTLQYNYGRNSQVTCLNLAIAGQNGVAPFYYLDATPAEHGYPDWLSQMGSLSPDRFTTLWDRYEGTVLDSNPDVLRGMEKCRHFCMAHTVSSLVECITLEELMLRCDIDHIDLLQIDIEGLEMNILRSIDFDRVPIRFINYESALMEKDRPDLELMDRWGYKIVDYGQDTLCYRSTDHAQISKAWMT